MGQIIVKTPDTINGDLVALENLVQAILFYDDSDSEYLKPSK
ncbi:hypothetical protein BPUTEOMOX_1220 [methanotrophic endosymbiont of Bathymodiolus puteoserpentis (Logatchev)]|nr:hypothetical protein BPUTEOMOX_1220 [methanotrophic endosymbiont of Bathymodiolus puteoserpentis (Logatchev)]